MGRIEDATEELLASIKESEVYLRYSESEKKLRERPGILENLDRLRRDIFHSYGNSAPGEFLNRADELQKQYMELQKIPEVNEFLEAEEELCRKIREIYIRMVREIVTYIPEI